MSLKLVKHSLKARPSKMSFISDFEETDSNKNQTSPEGAQHFIPSCFQEMAEPRPEGNETTIQQSPSDQSPELKVLNCDTLGLKALTEHSRQKVNRILAMYQNGNRGKMRHCLEKLQVFENENKGVWVISPDEVCQSLQCFAVSDGGNRPLAFLNDYTGVKLLLGEAENIKSKMERLIFPLQHDCYSAIRYGLNPFQNTLILAQFSSNICFADLSKEKVTKRFQVEDPVCLIHQQNTRVWAGDIKSRVLGFDYRIKNPVERLTFDKKEQYEPVLALDSQEERVLAGNKSSGLVWDLRKSQKPVYEVEFNGLGSKRGFFLAENRVVLGDVGGSAGVLLDLNTEKQRKFIDFKGKKIREMIKTGREGEMVWLLNNPQKKSEVHLTKFNERRGRAKKEDWRVLDGCFDHLAISESAGTMGVMAKDEVELIGVKAKGLDCRVRDKIRSYTKQ